MRHPAEKSERKAAEVMKRDTDRDYDLQRFLNEQEYDSAPALAAMRAGQKLGHWIWYVFPQLKGLGRSQMCELYGIRGAGEAAAYLAHPVLRARLVEISSALLSLESRDPEAVMGYIDAMKLRSCMTLFSRVEGADPVFAQVLDEFFDGEPDPLTLQMLDREARG